MFAALWMHLFFPLSLESHLATQTPTLFCSWYALPETIASQTCVITHLWGYYTDVMGSWAGLAIQLSAYRWLANHLRGRRNPRAEDASSRTIEHSYLPSRSASYELFQKCKNTCLHGTSNKKSLHTLYLPWCVFLVRFAIWMEIRLCWMTERDTERQTYPFSPSASPPGRIINWYLFNFCCRAHSPVCKSQLSFLSWWAGIDLYANQAYSSNREGVKAHWLWLVLRYQPLVAGGRLGDGRGRETSMALQLTGSLVQNWVF